MNARWRSIGERIDRRQSKLEQIVPIITHLDGGLEKLEKLVQQVDSAAASMSQGVAVNETEIETAVAQLLLELDGADAELPKLETAVSELSELLESAEPTRQAQELARLRAERERLRAALMRLSQRTPALENEQNEKEQKHREAGEGAMEERTEATQENWARGFPQTEQWRQFLELHSALAKWLQGTDLDMQAVDPETLDVQQITEAANKLRVSSSIAEYHSSPRGSDRHYCIQYIEC